MVFHWSLSDSKSPQVSRTLFSILADLNNAVVWMISTRPFISKSSSPFINPSVSVPRAPVIIGKNVTFMFHCFFSSFFSLSFDFTLWSARTARPTIFKFAFFVDYYKFRSSGRDWVIRLYDKFPEKFVRVILQDWCWVVHIPFVRVVKLKFLAQFAVDPFTHPIVSSLSVLIYCIRLLCDWLFRLCITYIYCFVAFYLLLLWYDWSLWCFLCYY